MTRDELVLKLDQARQFLTDGDSTVEDYLMHVAAIMDGNVEWALGGRPPTPTLRIALCVVPADAR